MTSERRRRNGEGSVRQRPDGIWEGRLSVGIAVSGRRQRLSVYGATEKEVVKKLRELAVQADRGTLNLTPSKLTLGEYVDEWIRAGAAADDADARLRESTRLRYTSALKHARPIAWQLPLAKLTALQLQRVYTLLAEAGVPGRTRQIIHTALHAALVDAVRKKVIPFNPADGVDKPDAAPKRKMRTWTAEQASAFLAEAAADRLEAVYWVALSTGMNQAEVFGLKPEDVDLEGGRVHVTRQLIELNGKHVRGPKLRLGPLKTKNRERTIAIPPIVVEVLRRHLARRLAEGLGDAELLFVDRDGGPLRKSNFAQRSFAPIIARAKVPRLTFHELRHSHATLLLESGEHLKTISERLGHASTDITLRTYSHVTEGRDRGAADRIGGVLMPKATTSS